MFNININFLPWHKQYSFQLYAKTCKLSQIYWVILIGIFVLIYIFQIINLHYKQDILTKQQTQIEYLRQTNNQFNTLQNKYNSIQNTKLELQKIIQFNQQDEKFLIQLSHHFSQLMYLNKLTYIHKNHSISLEGTSYSFSALNKFITSFSSANITWLENLQLGLLTTNTDNLANIKNNAQNSNINSLNKNYANNFIITTKYNNQYNKQFYE